MRYILKEYDNRYYCNNINVSSSGHIQWNCSNEVDTLVVSVAIGSVDIRNIRRFIENLCNHLNRYAENISHYEYTNIGDNMYAKHLTLLEKSTNNGTQIYIPGRSYLVIAIRQEDDCINVYLPNDNDYSIYKESSLVISYHVSEGHYELEERLFRKPREAGYYKISFFPEFSSGYIDGLIYYRIENVRMPITRQMIDNKDIYIYKLKPNMQAPVVESASPQVILNRR